MKVIGIAGWSGAGKTTLIAKLIPMLVARGLRVSTIKHAHHEFDIDKPGKDSFIHREAGATEVMVASDRRWALMHETRDDPAPGLGDLLMRLGPADLVLVEGFKREAYPRVEVHRVGNGKPFLFPEDRGIVALASDAPPPFASVPRLHLDEISAIADLVVARAVPIDLVRKGLAGIH